MRAVRTNLKDLETILISSKNGLKNFRYFNTRPLDIINSHLISILLIDNDVPVAYCHLDEENEKVWLGILVADALINKKIGSRCLDILTKISDILNIKYLYLSVDKDNYNAIHLYKKFNFSILEDKNNSFIMRRDKNV